MTFRSPVYTAFSTVEQEPLDLGENSLAEEIRESAYRRLQEHGAFGDVQARNAILTGYENGWWTAEEAYEALAYRELFGTFESFMRTYAAGVRALSAEIQARAA